MRPKSGTDNLLDLTPAFAINQAHNTSRQDYLSEIVDKAYNVIDMQVSRKAWHYTAVVNLTRYCHTAVDRDNYSYD